MDDPGRDKYFGGGSLNVLSHGESFIAFFKGYSFQLDGLYLMDEPEAALSPENQVEFVRILMDAVENGNRQYIIATHSPIILSCPNSSILSFDAAPIQSVPFRESRQYRFYMEFLQDPQSFLS
jgi:predicted ATPase